MVTEGDRSGVDIPDHAHKAANVVHAMLAKMQGKETYTADEINLAVEDLKRALVYFDK